MDSLITAAARALAAGDPLGALRLVALRDDPPALALRGIAMAQLGDFERARRLLRAAGRTFGAREALARARCRVAEAEVALAARDLGWPRAALEEARTVLEAHGDAMNAAHARLLDIRHDLLLGRLDEAERAAVRLVPGGLPPAFAATRALLLGGIAMRRLRAAQARTWLDEARAAAARSRIPALMAEVDAAHALLDAPAARLRLQGEERPVLLGEVEALFASPALVIDGCRHVVREGERRVDLSRRPVLFALAWGLAAAWPADATREQLVERAFRVRRPNETHRARLRVEVGRLRAALAPVATLTATARGFMLAPERDATIALLSRPVDDAHASVLAALADGEAWSSSAIAAVLGEGQRQVQRALGHLARAGKAQSVGQGRSRRWVTPPLPGITTALLLPGALPGD